jgi:hypothetical protein
MLWGLFSIVNTVEHGIGQRTTSGVFTLCCGSGRVHSAMPPLLDHPDAYEELLRADAKEGRVFVENARTYNNRFAFTSTCAKFKDPSTFPGGPGITPVVLHGALHHKISPLTPASGGDSAFAQIYVHDTDNELPNRLKFRPKGKGITRKLSDPDHKNAESDQKLAKQQVNTAKLDAFDRKITTNLQQIMHANNPFVPFFKTCLERLQDFERNHQTRDMKLVIRSDPSVLPAAGGDVDPRRYAQPQASEVAVIVDSFEKKRDIVLELRPGTDPKNPLGLQTIHITHQHYLALSYPLAFPLGEQS